jgi:hypothetical protein
VHSRVVFECAHHRTGFRRRVEALEYEQELGRCRGQLAQELNEEDAPDDVWGHVMKLGLPYEAITGGDVESWQALVGEAKTYMKKSREQMEAYIRPPGRSEERGAPDEVVVKPSENAAKRAEALAEVAATVCNNHPEVQRFRRNYLPGRLLTDEEARAFLDARGGPLGTGKAVRRTTPNPKWALHPGAKRYRTPSDMRELLGIADKLSKAYGWREGDALWFVLTGYDAPIRPLEVEMFINTSTWPTRDYNPFIPRINVTAHAWVNVEEVERAFREAQRQLLGGDANPPAKERTLEVVKFVAGRMSERKGETWTDRWKAWNRTCRDDWRYSTYNGFRQTYERFVERYMYRKYNHPNYKKRERTPYEAYRDDWNDKITGRKEKRARRQAALRQVHQ